MLSPAALSTLTSTFRSARDRNTALGVWQPSPESAAPPASCSAACSPRGRAGAGCCSSTSPSAQSSSSAPRNVDHAGAVAAERKELLGLRRADRMRFEKGFGLCEERDFDLVEQRAGSTCASAATGTALPFCSGRPWRDRGAPARQCPPRRRADRSRCGPEPRARPTHVLPAGLLVAIVDAHAKTGRRKAFGGFLQTSTARVALERTIGTNTASSGAIFGGIRNPRSSPCVMIIAPSMRHDMPHDVV